MGEVMKRSIIAMVLVILFVGTGISYAADDQASLGAQAGAAARELKNATDESLATGTARVAETSAKVQTEVQGTMKTLQQQWDVLVKQLQEKTKQFQEQLDQQWKDFNKSFNKQQP
jgi:uncharacterized protein HemX